MQREDDHCAGSTFASAKRATTVTERRCTLCEVERKSCVRMPPPPTERANATEWHTEETRALSATLKRLPSFAEWLVANKAHLECEAEIDERVQHQRTDHDVRKAVNTALAEPRSNEEKRAMRRDPREQQRRTPSQDDQPQKKSRGRSR
jgi:hypothetical protein